MDGDIVSEVAKTVYSKLIEAGIPVKATAYLNIPDYSFISRILEKQGTKKFIEIEEDHGIGFSDINSIKDSVTVPLILTVFMKIGKRMPAEVELNPQEKTYVLCSPVAKKYVDKFNKIMREANIELE